MTGRSTRIYTRTGDRGRTGLLGGRRLGKAHPRIAAIGEVDELNAQLGVVVACGVPQPLADLVRTLQRRLFDVGAALAGAGGEERLDAAWLEDRIDQLEDGLPALRAFVLPGGTPAAAHCHVARAVCRRAERSVAALNCREPGLVQVLVYLNRLSDLLFVLARRLNHEAGAEEPLWKP